MQPNKKYIASDGYEYFMCPMTEFKVTQVENVGTHLGTKSVDFASGTPGYRAPYYAPAKVKCVRSTPSSGEATWQTVNKVHCPNGYFGVVTFETVHDDTYNAYVGMVVNQGVQLGNMGAKGNATGVHVHLQFAQTADYSFFKNGYGIYMFNSESYVDDTFYVDDTNIIDGKAGNWRKIGSSSGNTQKYIVEEEHYAVRFTYDQIRIRKGSPDGEVIGYVNSGDEVEYFAKTVYNGHRWVQDKNKYWYAISNSEERGKDMWCELIDPSELKVNQKPSTPSEPEKPQEPEPNDTEEEWIVEQPDRTQEVYQPTEGWLEKFGVSFVSDIVTKDEYKYKAPFIMDPEFTVTHNSGTPSNPSAQALNTSMRNDETTQKSWHFSVDENTIVQGLPLNRNGWHAGDGRDGDGNRKGIAVEICRDMSDDTDAEFSLAERNAAILIADIMYQRGWTKETICKHQDFADKYCPHKTLDKGWDRYVDMVLEYLDQLMQFKAESDQPADSDQPEEGEKVDGGLINTLVSLLIKLVNKLLSIFK